MSGYALTGAADADLTEIARYTARQWGYPQAESYLLSLDATFRTLAAHPDTGRAFSDREGYFRIESGSHVVFYRKEPPGVLIVRVLHQRMVPRWHLPY